MTTPLPQTQRCDECDQDHATRDRLCPVCGAAFARQATAPTPPSLLPAALLGPPVDGTPLSQADQEQQMAQLAQRLRELLVQGGWLGAAGGIDGDVDLEALLAAGGGGGGNGGGRNGLSEEAIARLPVSQLHATSTMLLSVTVVVDGDGGKAPAKMEAIPAAFSPVPPDGARVDLVIAEPVTAHVLPLANEHACQDKVVVMQRGKQTFGKMLHEARRIGARGVLVVNSLPLWPYLMKDSKREATKEEDPEAKDACFIAMVSLPAGEALLARVRATPGLAGCLEVSEVEKDCLICICAFAEGESILRLPCSHAFHFDCCKKWLGLQKSCPACRADVNVRREG